MKQSYAAVTLTTMQIDPAEVTAMLGITPSQVWYAGQLIHLAASLRYKHNGWSLAHRAKHKENESIEIGVQTRELLEKLFMHEEELLTLRTHCQFEIACVLYCPLDESVPAVHFDAGTLQKLSILQAEIDIDIYVVKSP